jgi:predicted enzyme related to lactoylglutathione lyase
MPNVPTSDPAQFVQGAPILEVPDVRATAEFYHTALGFTSDAGTESADYTVLWRDNAAIHLARGNRVPEGVRVFFWVRDVNALHEHVQRQGIAIDVPIGTREYGVRDFSIRDTNGVVVVLGQDWD